MRACWAAATAVAFLAAGSAASGQDAAAVPGYGPQLEGFSYPYPQQRFGFTSQGQQLEMAFMDVAATGAPNGRTVLLLHGKNFCAATWVQTIKMLSTAGYRVLAPDQIGFCASTKPAAYQFSFQQLATNTRSLLRQRSIDRVTVVGHSMGGMLAARFALMFPDFVDRLVMVDPLGLEDWQAAGVPYATIDAAYQTELKTTPETIKAYQNKFYYHGNWKPDYDK